MIHNGNRMLSLVVAIVLGAVLVGCPTGSGNLNGRSQTVDPTQAYLTARKVLLEATTSKDGVVRSRALEALALTDGAAAGEVLMRSLDDPAVAVRFAAAMGIGDCEFAPATGKLQELMASPDTSATLQCAVIYALDRMGDRTHRKRLGGFLASGAAEVRANAALVLAKLGDPAAIRPLQEQLTNERHDGVRIQIVESLASLGATRSYGVLSAHLRAGQPFERLLAAQALGRTRSRQAHGQLVWAMGSDRPLPLRLVAAEGLARSGDNRGWSLAVRALQDPEAVAAASYEQEVTLSAAHRRQWQMLAAMALGHMGRKDAVDLLMPLLGSDDPSNRVAAAQSILHLLAEHRPPRPAPRPVAEPGPVEPQGVMAPPGPVEGSLRTAPPKD